MINKQYLLSLQRNYIKIPSELFSIILPPQCIAIYCLMASQQESYHPSIRYIGYVLRMSPTTVIRYIKILLRLNIIAIHQKGYKGRINKYKFIPVNEWNIND